MSQPRGPDFNMTALIWALLICIAVLAYASGCFSQYGCGSGGYPPK